MLAKVSMWRNRAIPLTEQIVASWCVYQFVPVSFMLQKTTPTRTAAVYVCVYVGSCWRTQNPPKQQKQEMCDRIQEGDLSSPTNHCKHYGCLSTHSCQLRDKNASLCHCIDRFKWSWTVIFEEDLTLKISRINFQLVRPKTSNLTWGKRKYLYFMFYYISWCTMSLSVLLFDPYKETYQWQTVSVS